LRAFFAIIICLESVRGDLVGFFSGEEVKGGKATRGRLRRRGGRRGGIEVRVNGYIIICMLVQSSEGNFYFLLAIYWLGHFLPSAIKRLRAHRSHEALTPSPYVHSSRR